MKTRFFISFCLLMLLFVPIAIAQAQKQWTLQQCIDYAMKNNIQVKQNILNANSASNKYLQSKAALLPSLNANGNHNYSYGRYIDPFTNQFINQRNQTNNFSLSSNLVLFNGLQLQNVLRQSKLDYISGRFDVEKIKNDISLNIAAGYLQILLNDEILSVTKQQVESGKMQLERTKKLVDAGSLTQGSLFDIESQAATEELNLINAQNQLDLAYLNLKQLMDIDTIRGFEIVKPILPNLSQQSIEMDSSKIFTYAEQNLPEVKSADTKVLSAEKGVAVAVGARSPKLYLNGSYGTGYSESRQRIAGYGPVRQEIIGYYNGTPLYGNYPSPIYENTPFKDQLTDNLSKSIGLSLSVPLFNGWQTNTGISQARINLESAKLNAQLIRNQLRKSIQQAYMDAQSALKKYNASTKAVRAMKESYRFAEQRYNAGLLNSLDFTTAKNNLSRAESELLQAKYESIFKQKVLDFYQGKALVF